MDVQKYKLVKFISELCIMLVYFAIIFSAVCLWREAGLMKFPLRMMDIVTIGIFYCAAFYILLYLLEGNRVGQRRILDLIFGFFFSAACCNFLFLLLFRIVADVPFWDMAVFFILLVASESAVGFFWIIGCHRIYEKFHFRKEALFIYGNREDSGEYVRVHNTINRYFKITQSVSQSVGLERILERIRESSVVFLGDIPVESRNVIVKYCVSCRIECYSIPISCL